MSKTVATALTVVLGVALLAVGIYVGAHPANMPGGLQRLFGISHQQAIVAEATDRIQDTYYRKLSDADLADAAIKGMVSSMDDRFSNYFTPAEYQQFQQQQNGEFAGVGMTVSAGKQGIAVNSTYPGSPARRAGIKPGDTIVAVNGKSLKGVDLDDATKLIKGPVGTPVTLTWLHDGKRITKPVERADVKVPVVSSAIRRCDGVKVGVVRLATFSHGAHDQVVAALRKVLKQGAKALVLDLRGNGGGLVNEAQLIVSAFVHGGTVVTTKGLHVESHTLKAVGEPVAASQPLVVLIDGNTASASEITAGALQDRGRAELVGTHSYGKGVFQEIMQLSNGGALDITAGQYFLPSGRNLGGKGVVGGQDVSRGAGLTPTVKTPQDTTPAKAAAGLRTAVCTAAAKV